MSKGAFLVTASFLKAYFHIQTAFFFIINWWGEEDINKVSSHYVDIK